MARIAVIGAGPSGLMSGWAALQMGHQVDIYEPGGADAVKRRIDSGRVNAGVFLLHDSCNLTPLRGTGRNVSYETIGSRFAKDQTDRNALSRAYADKVYGTDYQGSVSLDEYNRDALEYDGHAANALLFDVMKSSIRDGEMMAAFDKDSWLQDHDRVIVTAPLWASYGFDRFAWQLEWPRTYTQVYVHSGDAPAHESYVWYAPQPSVPWYRASGVFGRFSLEYPLMPHDVICATVTKPIAPPPDVAEWMADIERDRRVLFAGRMGRWEKGIEQDDVHHSVFWWLR